MNKKSILFTFPFQLTSKRFRSSSLSSIVDAYLTAWVFLLIDAMCSQKNKNRLRRKCEKAEEDKSESPNPPPKKTYRSIYFNVLLFLCNLWLCPAPKTKEEISEGIQLEKSQRRYVRSQEEAADEREREHVPRTNCNHFSVLTADWSSSWQKPGLKQE